MSTEERDWIFPRPFPRRTSSPFFLSSLAGLIFGMNPIEDGTKSHAVGSTFVAPLPHSLPNDVAQGGKGNHPSRCFCRAHPNFVKRKPPLPPLKKTRHDMKGVLLLLVALPSSCLGLWFDWDESLERARPINASYWYF